MNSADIPKLQWAITLPSPGKLQVKQIPVPQPASGEVLIKVMAAPINPSDLYYMKGMYDQYDIFKTTYPGCPGWEGAGLVVKSGGGIMGWRALGSRVAFARKLEGNEKRVGGSYQQYCIANAAHVSFLPEGTDYDIGSMSFVNPMTALGLRERIQELGATTAVQTGACSQVGQMLIKLCKESNIPLINIVRREEQVKYLKEEYGSEFVLNSSSDGFFQEFTALAKEKKATALIECVGGDMTGKLVECLPSRSTCVVYGALSEQPVGEIEPLLLIGRNYKIESFILGSFIEGKGIWILSTIKQCAALMADKTLESKVSKGFTLSQFQECVSTYYQNMSAGKCILQPHALDANLADGKTFAEFDIMDLKS